MPTLIPVSALDAQTLQNLIQEFVTRDGTDYGAFEQSLEQKVSAVHQQLMAGLVKIVFDEATESVNLLNQEQLQQAGISAEDGDA